MGLRRAGAVGSAALGSRTRGVEAPRVHDASGVPAAEADRLPQALRAETPRMAAISRDLRRDRELAFYGAEALTPSSFYSESDAERARDGARVVTELVRSAVREA